MNRYKPTPNEIEALKARGWCVDPDGWWWPTCDNPDWSKYDGVGKTYREAVKLQNAWDKEKQ